MNEFRIGDLDPRGSEELLKSFFAEAAVGFSITDLQGRFVRVNPAYCALVGYDESELKLRNFQSITHPDDLTRTMANVEALRAGKVSSYLIESRYVRKDDIVVWTLTSVSVGRDKSGRPMHLIMLAQDITEQLQLENSLYRAELRTESILTNISDVYLLFDRDWRYAYVNEAAVRAIGLPREEILGRTLWDLFPDIVGTELEHEYRRAMRERITVNLDFYYPSRDNCWENRFYPVPAGLAVFATDITGRKRAEASLKLFRSLLDRSTDAIEVIDPDTLSFLDCNQSACQSLGYSREEFLTLTVFDIDPNINELRVAAISEELKRSGFALFESIHRRKDGSTFPVEINVKQIQLDRGYRLAVVRDISERKQAEERLREYEKVVEGLEEMIVVIDREYRYLIANRAFLKLRDLKEEQVIGHLVAEIVGKEYFERFFKLNLDRCFRGEIVKLETKNTYPSLGERDLFISYFPIEGPAGIDRVACVFADRTEARRTENAIREAERKYRDIFENAGEGIFQSTPEGRYIAVNPELARMHGFDSPEDLIRSRSDIPTQTYANPERREDFKRLLEQYGTVRGFEYQIIRKDGSRIWTSVNARAVRDDQGKAIYYEGTSQDITEQKLAEAELRKSEKKYRDLVETAHDLIWAVDAQGTITFLNKAARKIYGREPEELIGRSFMELLSPEERVRQSDNLPKFLASGEKFMLGTECEVMDRDGNRHLLLANSVVMLDPQGNAIGTMGTSADITDRKRAEARSAAFATLARKLTGVRSQLDAGRIIAETAGDLFGWDACNLDLYDADQDMVYPMLNVDTIDGKRVELTPLVPNRSPTARSRRVIDHGPELFLREEPVTFAPDTIPFGDKSRPSASVMSVPIRHASNIIGLLSIQSYTLRAYDQAALADLEALAEHCGEALNRIRAEELLHESEERFRQLAENLEDVIWISDRNLKDVLYINAAYEKIFHRTRESVYEGLESFLEAVHPNDRKSVEDVLARQRHGEHRPFEYRIVRPDGTVRWVHRRTFPIRNDDGEVHLIAGIAQDITERKRAQEELRESAERYRDLVDNSRELICTHDLDGLVLSVNPAAADAVGYDIDELVGEKTVRDILAPDVRHEFDEYMAKLCKDGATTGIMYVQTKSGERRVWDYDNSLRTEGVATPVVRGMARDITEERRAQQALRESEERFRELFENAKDALYVHDLGGRYTSFNRAAEKLLGYSREEILGKHFSNFVAPGNLKDARTNLCKKLDLEGETTYEIELVTKDRNRVPVEVSSRLIFENGKPVGVQGVARDITDRKRAREALRTYSQRLIEAQEAERQVIARELHDEIGQVLTAVRINLQSLQSSAQSGSHSLALDDSLAIVDEALARVRELSLNLRPSVLDNLGLSSALRWYVDRYTQRSGIIAHLESDLEEGRRLRIELETACFRIVQEALTNVARHARATQVRVHLTSSNGTLDLKIKDNGVGFNVDALLKDSLPARALGLRGMEERAVAALGSFKIDSAPARGTEVSVSLPLKDGR